MNAPTPEAVASAAADLSLHFPGRGDDHSRPVLTIHSDGSLEFTGSSERGIDLICHALKQLREQSDARASEAP